MPGKPHFTIEPRPKEHILIVHYHRDFDPQVDVPLVNEEIKAFAEQVGEGYAVINNAGDYRPSYFDMMFGLRTGFGRELPETKPYVVTTIPMVLWSIRQARSILPNVRFRIYATLEEALQAARIELAAGEKEAR